MANQAFAYQFGYDFDTESFTIAAIDGSRTISLPRDKRLTSAMYWPIWPQPLFIKGDDGSRISIHGGLYGNKGIIFNNREEDWFARVTRTEVYAWLDRPERLIMDNRECPQDSGTRVDLERTTIELFDFRNGLQARFGATVIDDQNVIGNHARVDKRRVKAMKLTGGWFDNGGFHSYQDPEQIKAGTERQYSDFELNYAECVRMCTTQIGIDVSSQRRLFKGDPAKGEPLLVVHVMNKDSYRNDYAAPDKVLEFYGYEQDADGKSLLAPPLAEREGTSVHKVRGGYVIKSDAGWNEEFYLIDDLPWLFYARQTLPKTPACDIRGDLHVIDLERGIYLWANGGIHSIGPSRLKRQMLQYFTANLPSPEAAEGIVKMVNEGMMPIGKEELIRKGERGSYAIYSIPFKPTRSELKYIFAPERWNGSDDY